MEACTLDSRPLIDHLLSTARRKRMIDNYARSVRDLICKKALLQLIPRVKIEALNEYVNPILSRCKSILENYQKKAKLFPNYSDKEIENHHQASRFKDAKGAIDAF